MKKLWHNLPNLSKKNFYKGGAAALALLLSLSLGTVQLFAAGSGRANQAAVASLKRRAEQNLPSSVHKTEVIYAKLDDKGGVKELYAVNRFTGNKGETFDDFGRYTDVSQISLTGSMSPGKDVETISLGEEPFYYQGKMEGTALPWRFELTYQLDGQAVKPADLSGKSGALTINLHVEANPDCRGAKNGSNPWAKADMLQISMTFPAEAAFNIAAEGGQIAQVGSDQQVNFVLLPKAKPEDFKVTANIKNFHMPAMQIAAVPFSMDLSKIDMPDLSKNKEIADLKDGTKKLSDGSADLADGLKKLEEGAATLQTNLKKLTDGAAALDNNAAGLADGIRDYTGGADKLAGSSRQLTDGAGKLASGAKDLSDGLGRSAAGVKAYVDGVKQYVDGVNKLAGNLPAVSQGAADLKNGADQLAQGAARLGDGSQLLAGSAQVKTALDQINAGLAKLGTPEDMQQIKAQLQALGSAASELSTASAQFKTAITELNTGLSGLAQASEGLYSGLSQIIAGLDAQMNQQITPEELIAAGVSPATLQNPEVQLLLKYIAEKQTAGLTQLKNGLNQLYVTQDPARPAPAAILKDGLAGLAAKLPELLSGYTAFDTSVQQLAAALPQLAKMSDMVELASGLKQLATNYTELDQGLKAYIGGVNQLLTQVKQPAAGQENLYSGVTALSKGLAELAGGSGQLGQGSAKLTGDEANALKNAQDRLVKGSEDLADGLAGFSSGLAEYTGGVNRLAGNSAKLNNGVNEYLDGVKSLSDGMNKWAEGYNEFAGGVSKSEEGSRELASGMETLHKGTQTMDQNLVEMMDELLEDYQTLDGPQPSFTSEKNGDAAHVQFVIMTEEIKEPEKAETQDLADETKTFWDRFLDLFKG